MVSERANSSHHDTDISSLSKYSDIYKKGVTSSNIQRNTIKHLSHKFLYKNLHSCIINLTAYLNNTFSQQLPESTSVTRQMLLKSWKILLEQGPTACMPLQMTISTHSDQGEDAMSSPQQ